MGVLARTRAGDTSLTLEGIIRILRETYNRPAAETPERERQFNKFVARYGYGDSDAAREMVLTAFEAMAEAFVDAILSLAEGFDKLSATRAYFFALPSGNHAIDHNDRVPRMLNIPSTAPEAQHSFDDVIKFTFAGMRTMARSARECRAIWGELICG